MNEKQQKAIQGFEKAWTAWFESDRARERWFWQEVEKADKGLKRLGIQFKPGKGFIIL